MDTARVIRGLMDRDPSARHRSLSIVTFHVTPLTENSGILEWVPNVRPLRTLLGDAYHAVNLYDSKKTLNRIKTAYDKSVSV